jgi:alpha-tubulin suppressor-like RCC1 family protein
MEIRKSSGLLACAAILALTLLSGCGGSSTTTTIPATTSIFYAHSVIFRNSGTVMAMGYNAFGQLGQGNKTNQAAATLVNIGPMNGAATGGDHTLAFAFDNHSSVYAWGSNYHGQIGNSITTTGSNAFSPTPVRVALHGLNTLSAGNVTDVAAGGYHSLAVVDGTVFSWGYNGYGQLGDRNISGTENNPQTAFIDISPVPGQLSLAGGVLANIQKVAAGGLFSLALTDDGRVYSWGDNSKGELGRVVPLPVPYTSVPGLVTDAGGATLTGVTAIAAGGGTSYALKSDGTVWAWGNNSMGQLGRSPVDIAAIGTTPAVAALPFSPVAVQVTMPLVGGLPLEATKISAGLDHVLVLLKDGTVVGLGYNEYAQLGRNAASENSYVVDFVRKDAATMLTGVTDIIAFGNHSLAKVGGLWYGWGDNGFGQLGSEVSTSSIRYKLLPTVVQGY